MNNEQKYNKALEQAKMELSTCGSMDCDAARLIFRLFPQLEESEDEKTRKALIETVKCIYQGDTMFLSEQQRDRYLTWLEKQLQWKPSKEQINALNAITTIGQLSYAGQGDALISLYQDLKKLF